MRSTALLRVVMAASLAAISLGVCAAAGASTGTVPFNDPQADGYVGLCDLAGHNVTSGSLDSTPFAWKVVSSARPPKSYSGSGENADLDIYQARQGVLPGDWTGEDLMGATDYAHPGQPTAEATYKDDPLREIALALPPMWDGLYALRMQFGKTGYGVYNATYPMTVIQVTGNSWHVVSGGLVNCGRAKAVPQEVLTGVAKQQVSALQISGETPPTAPASVRATPTTKPAAVHTAAPATAASAGSSSGLTKTVAEPITAPVTLSHQGGGLSHTFLAVIVVAGLVAAGMGGLAIGRRSRTSGS
jgi:hypothetical protein